MRLFTIKHDIKNLLLNIYHNGYKEVLIPQIQWKLKQLIIVLMKLIYYVIEIRTVSNASEKKTR